MSQNPISILCSFLLVSAHFSISLHFYSFCIFLSPCLLWTSFVANKIQFSFLKRFDYSHLFHIWCYFASVWMYCQQQMYVLKKHNKFTFIEKPSMHLLLTGFKKNKIKFQATNNFYVCEENKKRLINVNHVFITRAPSFFFSYFLPCTHTCLLCEYFFANWRSIARWMITTTLQMIKLIPRYVIFIYRFNFGQNVSVNWATFWLWR